MTKLTISIVVINNVINTQFLQRLKILYNCDRFREVETFLKLNFRVISTMKIHVFGYVLNLKNNQKVIIDFLFLKKLISNQVYLVN